MTRTTRMTTSTMRYLSLLFWISSIPFSFTFVANSGLRCKVRDESSKNSALTRLSSRKYNDNNDEGFFFSEERSSSGFPQLPAFGASSFDQTSLLNQNGEQAIVDRKFDLLYTCKKCNTRNTHKVSRLAYYEGVVIATCKGCDSQHLIADNLGWTNIWDGVNNIEQDKDSRGEIDISRVTKEVFHLEKVLSNTGYIIGEDGLKALE